MTSDFLWQTMQVESNEEDLKGMKTNENYQCVIPNPTKYIYFFPKKYILKIK